VGTFRNRWRLQERLKSLPEENREKIVECGEQRKKLEKKVEEEEANYEAARASLQQETQVFFKLKCILQMHFAFVPTHRFNLKFLRFFIGSSRWIEKVRQNVNRKLKLSR
jgi:hypothetical protein